MLLFRPKNFRPPNPPPPPPPPPPNVLSRDRLLRPRSFDRLLRLRSLSRLIFSSFGRSLISLSFARGFLLSRSFDRSLERSRLFGRRLSRSRLLQDKQNKTELKRSFNHLLSFSIGIMQHTSRVNYVFESISTLILFANFQSVVSFPYQGRSPFQALLQSFHPPFTVSSIPGTYNPTGCSRDCKRSLVVNHRDTLTSITTAKIHLLLINTQLQP